MRIQHQLLAVLVAFIWGTNFVVIHYGLVAFSPFTLATLRFVFVAFPLMLFVPKPETTWAHLAAYGFFIGCGQFGLLFWVMQSNITPGLASLIIQMQIFITILLAVLVQGEHLRQRQMWALLVCFSGLSIIFLNTDEQTTGLGVVVTLIAATNWSIGNLIVKDAGKVDILAFLAWSSPFAVLPLAVLALYFEGPAHIAGSVMSASYQAWGVVLWQSLGNTLIGYGLWNLLLARYPAASVTPWALMVPVFGMSASSVVLNEPMPWWKLSAMLVIMLGLALNTLSVKSAQR